MKKIFLFLGIFSLLSLADGQVLAASLQITTKSLPDATFGLEYDKQIQAQDGTGTYTFSLVSGALPPGLNLSSDGKITDRPTKDGVGQPPFEFTVRVVDESTGVDNQDLKIRLLIQQLKITNPADDSVPSGTVGEPYPEFTFAASGGVPPYVWANPETTGARLLSSFGLQLSQIGELSGTPIKAGTFSFGVSVTGDPVLQDYQNRAFRSFTIEIKSVPYEITTVSLSPGEINKPYTATLSAHGGAPPYSWSIAAGSLPPGPSLSTNNFFQGIISGTLAEEGNFPFSALVRDTEGAELVKPFSILVEKVCQCSDGTSCGSCKAGSPPLYCDGTNKTLINNPTCTDGTATPVTPPPGGQFPFGKLEVDWPNSPMGTKLTGESLTNLIQYLYEWGIGIGGFLAFIALIIAGFQYLTSVGNAGKMSDAMSRIRSAGMGLVLLFGSFLILNTINPQLTDLTMPPPEQLINSGWDFDVESQQLSSPENKPATCNSVIFYPEPYFKGMPVLKNGINKYQNIEVKSMVISGGCSVTLYDHPNCDQNSLGSYDSLSNKEDTKYNNIGTGGATSFQCVDVSQM